MTIEFCAIWLLFVLSFELTYSFNNLNIISLILIIMLIVAILFCYLGFDLLGGIIANVYSSVTLIITIFSFCQHSTLQKHNVKTKIWSLILILSFLLLQLNYVYLQLNWNLIFIWTDIYKNFINWSGLSTFLSHLLLYRIFLFETIILNFFLLISIITSVTLLQQFQKKFKNVRLLFAVKRQYRKKNNSFIKWK